MISILGIRRFFDRFVQYSRFIDFMFKTNELHLMGRSDDFSRLSLTFAFSLERISAEKIVKRHAQVEQMSRDHCDDEEECDENGSIIMSRSGSLQE
jgi:hypothetical protein